MENDRELRKRSNDDKFELVQNVVIAKFEQVINMLLAAPLHIPYQLWQLQKLPRLCRDMLGHYDTGVKYHTL